MNEIEPARWAESSSHAAALQPEKKHIQGYAAVAATPWSGITLGVTIRGGVVSSIDFLSENAAPHTAHNALARATVRQLRAYFRDPRYRFTLLLGPQGTSFQRAVWDAMRRIPAGETRSYGELARQLGTSPRAVGGACRANPIPLIIPCHRVVAAHGIGGFMGVTRGRGIQLKQRLLAHEFFF